LNKRKEREARLASSEETSGSQEYGQIPNRSPASEESNKINYTQVSPRSRDSSRKATPSPKHQAAIDHVQPPRKVESQIVQNDRYEKPMNNRNHKVNEQDRNPFREEYQRMMRHSQQGYFFPSIQNEYYGTMRNMNGGFGPFNPQQPRPESSEMTWNKAETFVSPGPTPWRYEGIERALHQERNKAPWDKLQSPVGGLHNTATATDWNSWNSGTHPNISHRHSQSHTHSQSQEHSQSQNRGRIQRPGSSPHPQEAHHAQHGTQNHNANHYPNRPNQTSVIRYDNNHRGMYPTGRKQEMSPKYDDQVLNHIRNSETYYQTENKYCPKEETDEIKQELSSSEDENPQIETNSSIIQYPPKSSPYFDYQSVERKCDNSSDCGSPGSNSGKAPLQPYASVIKRNIEASANKNRLHTIVNFRQVDIPKPMFNTNVISNYTSVEEFQEIKSEDIEADINDQFSDNSDSLSKACNEIINETFNDNFKIQIPKRKSDFSSDSEEEESSPVAKERSLVPLKKRQRMLEIPYATGHAVNRKMLPVMSFTFEEEFKVVDYIVRIEQYQNRRFEFICKNFHQYKELMAAFVGCTHMGRKIPFNRPLETKLFTMGLEFTKQSSKEIYQEMGVLSSDVRREVLNGTYPALYVVMYAILEGNTREKTWMDQHLKTLHTTKESHEAIKDYIKGLENVRSISLKDQERFTSPWAVEMADEEKFERTVSLVGRLLRDDIQLQALYHMFVMMRPSPRASDKIQGDQSLTEVQIKISQLIYRYLSTKSDFKYTKSGKVSEDSKVNTSGPSDTSSSIMNLSEDVDDLNPDEKTRLLISLVDDLHDCVDIMQCRSLLVQAGLDI